MIGNLGGHKHSKKCCWPMKPYDYCDMTCPKGYRVRVKHATLGRSDDHSCPHPQYPYGKNENPWRKNKWLYNKYKDMAVGCRNAGISNFKVSTNEDIEVWGPKNWRLNTYVGTYKKTAETHNDRPVFRASTGKVLFSTKWGHATKNYWVVGDSVVEVAKFPAWIRSDAKRPDFRHDHSWWEQKKGRVGSWRSSGTFHAGSLGKRWGELLFKMCKSGHAIGNRRCSVTDLHRGATICPKSEWTDCADIGDPCPNTQKVLELEWWCMPSTSMFTG